MICYKHGSVKYYKCDECGCSGWHDEDHVLTSKCDSCDQNLCRKCKNQYKHRKY